ncbi:DUF6000 family protein [Micromonospora auratinigra]|uniref:Uncharacterized protein n=1 Tax=Micromonospora auratinigra TaxID=261654 RepID=A0A1A8ZAT9_9ACTN|nr:DUF6000 family protein [Micromonospora auratinigra]SBT40917.1 hypothetical protein GA0070611_1433 [Micromonospora auratinigra]
MIRDDGRVEPAPPLPDPAADPVRRRYVIVTPRPARPRYLGLLGGRLARADSGFVHALRRDAEEIGDEELTLLLQPGGTPDWRPRLVAAYLIGIGRRTRFRETIAHLLLASESCYSGQGYCFALAAFGTGRDAEILSAYLDRYLPRLDLRYDQHWALAALRHLDTRLGTGYAERHLGPGGGWETWARAGSSPDLDSYQELIAAICAGRVLPARVAAPGQ